MVNVSRRFVGGCLDGEVEDNIPMSWLRREFWVASDIFGRDGITFHCRSIDEPRILRRDCKKYRSRLLPVRGADWESIIVDIYRRVDLPNARDLGKVYEYRFIDFLEFFRCNYTKESGSRCFMPAIELTDFCKAHSNE